VYHRGVAALTPLLLLTAAWALDEPPKGQVKATPIKSAKGGQTDKAQPPQLTPAGEALQALRKEVQTARSEILDKYGKADKDEEKQQYLQQYYGVGRTFAARFLELAQKHADDPAAVQALMTLITDAEGTPEAGTAADLILKNHLADPQLATLANALARSPSATAERLLRSLMTEAKEKDNRGKATFALAQSLKERASSIRALKGAPADRLASMRAQMGDATVADLLTGDPAAAELEAEMLFERVGNEFADVKDRDTSIAERAKSELFELRFLAVGKTAPDIEGADIDDVKFKLSDYRGKVVLLDFWGNW